MIPKNFMAAKIENYSCLNSLRGRQKWKHTHMNIKPLKIGVKRLSIYVSLLFPPPYECSEFIIFDFKMISSDYKNNKMYISDPCLAKS